ncbi:MAG: hypothetical protein IPH08_15690 [Rhodocyclaceae bacterium]|jgi:hypothetical protein|nr:hypothetical protein [Rhodocyclaceae bacterium]MBK6908446.1 hypothetical protein [Rhodocyclaceae bacterium]
MREFSSHQAAGTHLAPVAHFERELFEISERIARLTLALDVEITPHFIEDVLASRHLKPLDHEHNHGELRALLVMHFEIVTHAVDTLGDTVTFSLLAAVETHLATRGFDLTAFSFLHFRHE